MEVGGNLFELKIMLGICVKMNSFIVIFSEGICVLIVNFPRHRFLSVAIGKIVAAGER